MTRIFDVVGNQILYVCMFHKYLELTLFHMEVGGGGGGGQHYPPSEHCWISPAVKMIIIIKTHLRANIDRMRRKYLFSHFFGGGWSKHLPLFLAYVYAHRNIQVKSLLCDFNYFLLCLYRGGCPGNTTNFSTWWSKYS